MPKLLKHWFNKKNIQKKIHPYLFSLNCTVVYYVVSIRNPLPQKYEPNVHHFDHNVFFCLFRIFHILCFTDIVF